MQGSGQSGGGHRYERWFREFMIAKNPLGMLAETSWQPPTDVYETNDAVVVRMEIPGVDPASLDIHLDGDALTIQGVRADCTRHRKVAVQQMEIHCGHFKRSILLRCPVQHEGAAAEYHSGFLTIVLPRARKEAPVSTFYIKINL